MIRVLVADDHAVVRRGVIQILSEESDILVAGEASSGQEALQAVQQHRYEVVLLDISLPDRNGLEVLSQLQALNPDLRVLILSVYPEEQYAVRALKAGAAGYLTKESTPDELLIAVRKVASGGKYVSLALAEKLAFLLEEKRPIARHEMLSDREDQVMRLLAAGKTVSEIAETLSLSVKTVSTYRTRILEKLQLSNNAEIMRYALQHGLLE